MTDPRDGSTASDDGTDGAAHPDEFGVGPAYPTAHTSFTDDRAARSEPRRTSADAAPTAAADSTGPVVRPHREAMGTQSGGGDDESDSGNQPVFAPTASFTVADGVRDVGMVFIGASTTSGYGDPKGLGWVGRVVARTQHPDLDLTAYNLGVRGQTSGDVVARWQSECQPRWQGRTERRLVVSVGAGDIESNMTMARSRLNLANVLDEAASSGIGAFVVGLTPTLDSETNRRIEALAHAQADVCARRGVTYVDCYRPLVSHDQWMADVAASPDRVHPGQAGYGLIAWLVLHNGWNDWLSIS